MDLFSYLIGKKSGGVSPTPVIDTSDLREVINMTDADVTSETPFSNYPQALYNGYINVLKDSDTLLDNMTKGTSTGSISEGLGLPIYNMEMTKLSTQDGTPSTSNPVEINTVKGVTNLFNQANPPYFNSDTATYSLITNGIRITNSSTGTSHKVRFRINTTSINTTNKTLYIKSTIGSGTTSSYYGFIVQASNTPDTITDVLYQSTTNESSVTVNITDNYDYIFIGFVVNMQTSQGSGKYVDYQNIYVGFENSDYVAYGTNWISTTISDGTNTKNVSISLGNNEIVGKGTVLDELIIDKDGNCWLNKKFTKINSYNGETIDTDYWSTTGGLDTGATIYYVSATPSLIYLNYKVNLTLYEGANTITNSENMNQEITYIKNTYD